MIRVMVNLPGPVAGRHALALKNTLSRARQTAIHSVEEHGVHLNIVHEFQGAVLNGYVAEIPAGEYNLLASIVGEDNLKLDTPVYALLDESVPLIGADQVWTMVDESSTNVTGQGITVAIIDSGVDYKHVNLGGCFGPTCKVIGGYDYIESDNDPMDAHGHGTHVAGIVAGTPYLKGVAPDAKLLAYRVLNENGAGSLFTTADAIEQAVLDGADVINLSVGGNGYMGDTGTIAVDNAVNAGVVVVVAAGNSGPSAQTLLSPAIAHKSIAVGNTYKNDSLSLSSSRGPVPLYGNILYKLSKPDISAPGTFITSTYSKIGEATGYAMMSGTSMASPHVAGVAALLLQLHPNWTPEMVRSALMSTTKPLSKAMVAVGTGRVRANWAASTPLLSSPAEYDFGKLISGQTNSTTFSLSNTTNALLNISGGVTINRAMASDGRTFISPLEPQANMANIQFGSFTINPGESANIVLNISMLTGKPEGLYEGFIDISVYGQSTPFRIPFTFWYTTEAPTATPTATATKILTGTPKVTLSPTPTITEGPKLTVTPTATTTQRPNFPVHPARKILIPILFNGQQTTRIELPTKAFCERE